MVESFIKIAVIFGFVMSLVPVLVYLERRISARIQNRYGPIMVGLPNWKLLGPLAGFHMWGLLQPLADALKFMFKEDFMPATSERFLYRIAPALVMVPAGIALAAIPFGPAISVGGFDLGRLVIFDTQYSLLFVLAATSIGVHGLTLAGWASNNKFSQMGGVRATAQLISYEAPMFISLLSALMLFGTVGFYGMIDYQAANGWMIWHQPLAFVIFVICAFAETNRHPFDMPEAEPELVGGYHTEYGGMGFATFFLGEYIAMINQCAVLTLVFLGGWLLPFAENAHLAWGGLAGAVIFLAKVFALLAFMILVRWSLPRFRYDQLMTLGWKRLTPLAIANLALTAIIGVLAAS